MHADTNSPDKTWPSESLRGLGGRAADIAPLLVIDALAEVLASQLASHP